MSEAKRRTSAARQRLRRALFRRKMIRLYGHLPCMDCGNNYPWECMDFDHRPGTHKSFTMANALHYTWATVEAEVEKCDLVCANCHRIRTQRHVVAGTNNNRKKKRGLLC